VLEKNFSKQFSLQELEEFSCHEKSWSSSSGTTDVSDNRELRAQETAGSLDADLITRKQKNKLSKNATASACLAANNQYTNCSQHLIK